MPATAPLSDAESDGVSLILSLLGKDGRLRCRRTASGSVAVAYRGQTGRGRTREDAIRDLALRVGLLVLLDIPIPGGPVGPEQPAEVG